jgi:hypothetical protein
MLLTQAVLAFRGNFRPGRESGFLKDIPTATLLMYVTMLWLPAIQQEGLR